MNVFNCFYRARTPEYAGIVGFVPAHSLVQRVVFSDGECEMRRVIVSSEGLKTEFYCSGDIRNGYDLHHWKISVCARICGGRTQRKVYWRAYLPSCGHPAYVAHCVQWCNDSDCSIELLIYKYNSEMNA